MTRTKFATQASAGRRLHINVNEPAPTAMAEGIGDVNKYQYRFVDTPISESPMTKPPFEPLTMARVLAAPLTGLTHVSTFSGGGGSCLGFRLAGFKTLWANDLEAHARACYSANLPSPIDGRDIKNITATDILTQIGLQPGELDVFEGSPPCTAFSTAGKREKGWGKTKDHAGHVQTNVEDLFFEWLRLLEGLHPRMFVAENVAGMVKGVAKGYFKDILRKMKALGYRTSAQVLDAQWLGVPQRRTRVIFIGVRDDLGLAPTFPKPLGYRYSVRDALPWLMAAKFDTGGQFKGEPEFVDKPCPTIIGAAQAGRNAGHYMVQDAVIHDRSADDPSPPICAARATDLELDTEITGRTGTGYQRRPIDLNAPMNTVMASDVAQTRYEITDRSGHGFSQHRRTIDEPMNTVMSRGGSAGQTHLVEVRDDLELPPAKQSRAFMAKRRADGLDLNDPCPAVTLAEDDYAVLSPTTVRRKFTIAELRRICSFPDDYVMEGPYAKQWARLGNSVPPVMAQAIAMAVRDLLLSRR